jgi:hypothetical protein
MISSIILCAGNQSRFFLDVPKPLMLYKENETILDINIKTSLRFCDVVYVVLNEKLELNKLSMYIDIMKKYQNVNLIMINSGKGTGHALMNCIKKEKIYGDIFLMWGDSIQDNYSIFKKTIENYNKYFSIPVQYEKDPYVKFCINDKWLIHSVLFKKYGEVKNDGYHDFSLFLLNGNHIHKYLECFHNNYYSVDLDKYLFNNRNNEFDLFDVINLYRDEIKCSSVIIDKNSSINSFNTVDEYKNIIKVKK